MMTDPMSPMSANGGGAGGERTRKSMTLRESGDSAGMQQLLDPATKSLAEALKITYRLVQFAMIAIVVVYLLSGLQSVNEGERGVRLTLGRVVADDLPPGFQFSWPQPFGELVKVRTSQLQLTEAFWPALTDAQRAQRYSELTMGPNSLDPTSDGSVLTADGNIAHVRYTAIYRRVDPAANTRSIHPDAERDIVRAAVRRGAIHASASLTIDELIKNAPAEEREGVFESAETIARRVAQETLDRMNAGIAIDQLALEERVPPRRVLNEFNEVTNAQNQAGSQRETAETDRRNRLTDTAGQAAPVLLRLIDDYEAALEIGGAGEAEAVLAKIDAVLDGEQVAIDGEVVRVPVTGQVTTVLNDARSYQTRVVNDSKAQAERFLARLESYRANPRVTMYEAWTGAMGELFARDHVGAYMLPPGARELILQINRDPEVERERTIRQQQEENIRARDDRRRQREQERFEGQRAIDREVSGS